MHLCLQEQLQDSCRGAALLQLLSLLQLVLAFARTADRRQAAGSSTMLGLALWLQDYDTQALLVQQLHSVMRMFARLGRQHTALKLVLLLRAKSISRSLSDTQEVAWDESYTNALLDLSVALQQDAELGSVVFSSCVRLQEQLPLGMGWRAAVLGDVLQLLHERVGCQLQVAHVQRGQLQQAILAGISTDSVEVHAGSVAASSSPSSPAGGATVVDPRLTRLGSAAQEEIQLCCDMLEDVRRGAARILVGVCTAQVSRLCADQGRCSSTSTPEQYQGEEEQQQEEEEAAQLWQLYKPVLLQLEKVRWWQDSEALLLSIWQALPGLDLGACC
jgi:hypothetical protein